MQIPFCTYFLFAFGVCRGDEVAKNREAVQILSKGDLAANVRGSEGEGLVGKA